MPLVENELTALIRREIAAAGPISFARFMQLALYHPVHGYYQQPAKQIGCQGDFYTSVSVGPLFGQLLGAFFSGRLSALDAQVPSATVQLLEGGAHDGQLARDILSCLAVHDPALFKVTRYGILEPSAVRREVQAQTLRDFGEKVFWVAGWDCLPERSIRGVIFANELLDAFPVLRLGWDSALRRWFEWRVNWVESKFEWVRGEAQANPELRAELVRPVWRELPDELLFVLPDGFTVEAAPLAREWWTQAAARLGQGSLLTIDYGLDWTERFDPARHSGTIRAYRRHRVSEDPLRDPGQRDLTAHVDFSGLIEAGEAAGLKTDEYGPQGAFLTRILRDSWEGHARWGGWNELATQQFQTLTHPAHLGAAFRVLGQSR